MHETPDDLRQLQQLLDDSHRRGGSHLRSIFTDDLRVSAEALCELLPGVQVLNLATVSSSCEPRVAPVDGLFYRGKFHFGSSADSLRFRHIRSRPQVSAAHTRGEELAVIVHGRAKTLDLDDPHERGFRSYLLKVYGASWQDWASGAPYARIQPTRMFTRFAPPG